MSLEHTRRLTVALASLLASACAAPGQAPPATQRGAIAAPAEAVVETPPPAGVKEPAAARPPAAPQGTAVVPPDQAIARLFSPKGAQRGWFSEAFLAKVPVEKIDAIAKDLGTRLGAFREVKAAGASFEAVFERGLVPTEVRLDAEGRIAGLFFRSPVMNPVDLEVTLAAFRALRGRVAVLVQSDGAARVALEADTPLAVGSAFKLAVLAALRDQIAEKKRAWTDVVTLKESRKSLPSGFLQTWPEGTPLTVASLAALMISQSDNTATDLLLERVGRAAVERHAPSSRPFLATREAFVLKAPSNEALLARYRGGAEAARRELLGEIAALPLPAAESFGEEPRALDVEWMLSARELCGLIRKVGELPLMAINPGVARASDWERVAFKGGSEAGVLNLTTLVQAKGQRHCVVATWNDPEAALDEARFYDLYGQLLGGLRGG